MKSEIKQLLLAFIIIPIILGSVLFFVYRDSKIIREPIKIAEWEENVKAFKLELKDISIPPETEIDDNEDLSKRGKTIYVKTRFKTQLPKKQFVEFIENELKKNNWKYYDKINNIRSEVNTGYSFCRGKSEAELYYKGDGGVFAEKGIYYELAFSSSFDNVEGISENCK